MDAETVFGHDELLAEIFFVIHLCSCAPAMVGGVFIETQVMHFFQGRGGL